MFIEIRRNKMYKTISVVMFVSFIGLMTGCAKSPEQMQQNHAKIKANLPENCSIQYAGHFAYNEYSSMPVVYVVCESKTMVATNMQESCGKSQCPRVVINTVEDKPVQLKQDQKIAIDPEEYKRLMLIKNAVSKLTTEERKALGFN